MIPQIFDINRRLQFKKRAEKNFVQHDFLHKEIFLNHLENLSMILQDMPKITLIDVPHYFLELPEAQAFFHLKKTTHIETISRDSEIFPQAIKQQNAIIALLTCHTINDLVGYFIQIRNALQSDGVFTASFIGENINSILKNAFMNAELDMTNISHHRFHPVIDIKTLGGLLQRAGFSLPIANSEEYKVNYKDFKTLIADIRGMGENNCFINKPKSLRKSIYYKALDNLYKALPDKILKVDMITLTGRCPSDAQQKPLKRGSGQISLTKVL